MLKFFVLSLIRFYQATLSFDHGPLRRLFPGGYCKFQPSCSDYAYLAVSKYGVWRGSLKAIWRVMRCTPFSRGGLDQP